MIFRLYTILKTEGPLTNSSMCVRAVVTLLCLVTHFVLRLWVAFSGLHDANMGFPTFHSKLLNDTTGHIDTNFLLFSPAFFFVLLLLLLCVCGLFERNKNNTREKRGARQKYSGMPYHSKSVVKADRKSRAFQATAKPTAARQPPTHLTATCHPIVFFFFFFLLSI